MSYFTSFVPTPELVRALKRRRIHNRLQRLSNLVSEMQDPTDAQLDSAQLALEAIRTATTQDLIDKTSLVRVLFAYAYSNDAGFGCQM